MVADNVSGPENFAGDLRTLLHIASDQKKSRMHIMPGEDFQQAQRVSIIGTVVVRQRNLSRPARQSRERFSIPLPRRRHRLVTGGDRGRGGNGSQGEREHEGIVFH